MTVAELPDPPAGLAESGTHLWNEILANYELDPHELMILREACRTADRLDRLAAEGAGAPLTRTSQKTGDEVANPIFVEARQQSIVFARLIGSLRLPADASVGRPQRRGGVRGVYSAQRKPWAIGS